MNFVSNRTAARLLTHSRRRPVSANRPREDVGATRLWHVYKPIVLYMGMVSLLVVGSLGSL